MCQLTKTIDSYPKSSAWPYRRKFGERLINLFLGPLLSDVAETCIFFRRGSI